LESLIEFLKSLYQPEKLVELIRSDGYTILSVVVFAETGLFVGFFLPGDSLLFTAGLVASQGFFNITLLMGLLSLMAIVGDAVGFSIGYKAGAPLYKKEDSFWFRRKHLLYAKEFYERHGGKAIFLARFVPFARTFAPVVAGIAQMSYPRFAAYNVFGGIFWVAVFGGDRAMNTAPAERIGPFGAALEAQHDMHIVVELAPLHEARQVGAQRIQLQPADEAGDIVGVRADIAEAAAGTGPLGIVAPDCLFLAGVLDLLRQPVHLKEVMRDLHRSESLHIHAPFCACCRK